MASFISDVLKNLQAKEVDFSQLTFILPSRRAGTFLKHELSILSTKPLFAPLIISIEELVEELSQLKKTSNVEILFEFYEVYLQSTTKTEIYAFEDFIKWAQIAIQDFNEIDRHLIEPNYIFDYLSAIKELNHWSAEHQQTPLIKNYLSFWKHLKTLYQNFYDHLKEQGLGYQGMLYREAVENLENYIQSNPLKQHVFMGFNALNKAETTIIQELLHSEIAEIYWDIDNSFLENKNHEAGNFIREHKRKWRYFESNPFHWIHDHYSEKKNIQVIGTPKNVGQAKYIGELLKNFSLQNKSFNKTAVVLSDENLLMPVLNSIPPEIDALNVTMGFPLESIPLASLFEQLFLMHSEGKATYYYKDVIALFTHPFIKPLFQISSVNQAEELVATIQKNNIIYLSKSKLDQLLKVENDLIALLFRSWQGSPKLALENCQKLILKMKASLDENKKYNLLSLEYLYKFNEIFNALVVLNNKHQYISSVKTLFQLFKELLKSETLDFQGEPLNGLQIMGMLESRVLDFETVIISSVNEGILPSGKSNNSFIPFDVKIENQLPTFKEKDAVYAYHFYRLIQRAKNVYIIYNTEPDSLNAGEKSRFITQLEIDPAHELESLIVSPHLPKINTDLLRMKKSEGVQQKLDVLFQKGLSPSSLLNYIRNPIDFYAQKILETEEHDDVEEVVEAKTLGTVIHEALKELYTPFKGKELSMSMLEHAEEKVNTIVTNQFKIYYLEGELDHGKNLIILEIAKQYIKNFILNEKRSLKQGNTLKILELEVDVRAEIKIDEISFPVVLRGQIDRVDEYNGMLRVIDYKTGKVEQSQVEIISWDEITSDYKKSGVAFQVLMYAFIMNENQAFNAPIEAGIISFKNLNSGFLKFSTKDRNGRGATKDSSISQEVLLAFQKELEKLILEIYDKKLDFIEKEIIS